MEAGDIYLADLHDEVRRTVLVASTRPFNQFAQRVLVVPEVPSVLDEVLFPWRVQSDDVVFAVDLLRSIPIDRLLKRTGRASADVIERVRRSILHITH